ncbi:MAG: hypothetical protein HY314_06630 [Acidobacteria bacterium]|nr:hypothetical protein [Acidobacteriota bacterium]
MQISMRMVRDLFHAGKINGVYLSSRLLLIDMESVERYLVQYIGALQPLPQAQGAAASARRPLRGGTTIRSVNTTTATITRFIPYCLLRIRENFPEIFARRR